MRRVQLQMSNAIEYLYPLDSIVVLLSATFDQHHHNDKQMLYIVRRLLLVLVDFSVVDYLSKIVLK
jgi:hypothetical protein